MTTLKNKIIKNFIAGILSCILVFSILVTLLVTINYNDLFKAIDDKRPKEVVEQFTRLNNDPNISGSLMWDYLSNMAIDQKVDIIYYDENDKLIKNLKGRDESDNSKIFTKEYNFIDDVYFRSEEHTSELQSRFDLVCRLLLEKKKNRL